MLKRINKILEIITHKIKVGKNIYKFNGGFTIRVITHDLDKLLLTMFTPLKQSTISKLHKRFAKHHRPVKNIDFIESCADWYTMENSSIGLDIDSWEYLENGFTKTNLYTIDRFETYKLFFEKFNF